MITSDKQYSVSRAQLAILKQAAQAAHDAMEGAGWLREVEAAAIESQIADIETEIAEYEMLKSGSLSFTKAYSLEELPRVLVQARIAAGISQTDLASRLGMKPQQIQRYEATQYMGASLARLIQIAAELSVKASGTFEQPSSGGGSVFMWSDADDVVWSQFPIKEMIKRRWFEVPRGAAPFDQVKEYFLSAAGPQFATAYHRKKVRGGGFPNEYALLAWQARVLEKARMLEAGGTLADFELDDSWVSELADLTKLRDGPSRARALLEDHGIALVVERHLPGTYLDGAAMLTTNERPVVGLTLRHDRLDNFWFVLFHELGHVFLHLLDGLRYDFFDDEAAGDSDPIEAAADEFALETLIPSSNWDECLSRFAISEEAVRIDADNLGLHPSIIAGRIRKERGNYTILSSLVGQGTVREQFEDEL